MWTAVGQESVLRMSTMPNTGLRAREAMPVLKDLEVMSTMAAPVVSEPVPAVVGTGEDVNFSVSRGGIAVRQLASNERPKFVLYWKSLSDRCIYEVHKVCVFINRKTTQVISEVITTAQSSVVLTDWQLWLCPSHFLLLR